MTPPLRRCGHRSNRWRVNFVQFSRDAILRCRDLPNRSPPKSWRGLSALEVLSSRPGKRKLNGRHLPSMVLRGKADEAPERRFKKKRLSWPGPLQRNRPFPSTPPRRAANLYRSSRSLSRRSVPTRSSVNWGAAEWASSTLPRTRS